MSTEQGARFGPYEIIERIGSGGMGDVYRARDTRLDREVALKLVSDRYISGGSSPTPTPATGSGSAPVTASRTRFLREARAASALNHPNICIIHDIGEQDGQPYLVMELLHGQTLKQYMAAHRLSVGETILFAQQAASALAAAHARGIIHRDIKPANIFVVNSLDGHHQIKILDFGLAKRQGEGLLLSGATGTMGGENGDMTATGADMAELTLTSPGSTIGTIAYMSPEQARGETLDGRSDLYSLGTVIYEMATGTSPFAGASAAEVFASLLMKDPLLPTRLNPALPAGIDPIVARLLAKDKEDRYASAVELRNDLELLGSDSSSRVPAARPANGVSKSLPAAVSETAAVPAAPPAALQPPAGYKSAAFASPSTLYAGGSLLLLIGLAIGGYLWLHGHRAAPSAAPAGNMVMTEKDSIILSDFVNSTGDPVFDTTLNQALAIQLQQSPMLNIVSQQHLRQSMKYLGRSSEDALTPAIAREIGEREGVKAILTGTIAKLGTDYVVTLAAETTATGDNIASEQAQSPDKEHVLDALDKAATAMRARLGESLSSIQKLDTPLGQATTPSLEAFRAYALGDVEHEKGLDFPKAAGHYRQALDIDPKFAMAWARLGVVYINSGQTGKALEYFSKAYELSSNVSERERLYIAGHYYQNVLGDIAKVIDVLELSIKTYPREFDSYVNLGVAYSSIGAVDKALDYTNQAVKMQPDDEIAEENLISNLLLLDRFDEAEQAIRQSKQLGIGEGTNHQQLLYFHGFLTGNQAEMNEAEAKVAGRADEYQVTTAAAFSLEYQGRYREAQAMWRRAAAQAAAQKATDAQAGMMLSEVTGRGVAQLCDGEQGLVKAATEVDRTKQTLRMAAYAAAACADAAFAGRVADDLAKKYPSDTIIQEVTVPQTRALLAMAQHKPDEALKQLESNRSYDFASPGAYLRGLAFLQGGDSASAITAFQQAVKYRGLALSGFQNYPQAQLGLARAYALAGNKAAARQAYQSLFDTWKHADPDLPQLLAARKEFAQL